MIRSTAHPFPRNAPDSRELQELARSAGSIMRGGFQRRTESNPDETDGTGERIRQRVWEFFERKYPHIPLYTGGKFPEAEIVALCDPLDGDNSFTHGIPLSTFCISLVRDGRPVEAVIHDPFFNRLWHASYGQGSFLNKKAVRVSPHDTFDGANISMVWPHESPQRLYRVFKQLRSRDSRVLASHGSVAIFGGLVSSGLFEASIFSGADLLETAAMHLIVEEAGGKATDLQGNPLVYRPSEDQGHIISNGRLHRQLVKLIQQR